MSIGVLNGGEEEPFGRPGRWSTDSNIHEFLLTRGLGPDARIRPLTLEDFARTGDLGRVTIDLASPYLYN